MSQRLHWMTYKVSQGLTRSHKVSQGLTRPHKVSQGLTRSHKASQGITRSHKVPQGPTRSHKDFASEGEGELIRHSYGRYIREAIHRHSIVIEPRDPTASEKGHCCEGCASYSGPCAWNHCHAVHAAAQCGARQMDLDGVRQDILYYE